MNLRSPVHDMPNDNIISERHGHNGPGGVCISRDFGASWKHEAQGMPPCAGKGPKLLRLNHAESSRAFERSLLFGRYTIKI